MERALPLLTAAMLVAALAGCSAGAEHATMPPPTTAPASAPEPAPAPPVASEPAPAPAPEPVPTPEPASEPVPTPAPEQESSEKAAAPDASVGNSPDAPSRPQGPATSYAQDRSTGEAKARIVVGAGGAFGQAGLGAYVCKLISTPTVSLYSAGGSMSGSGVALAVDANESGTTVLELPAGEISLTAYCTDPGGVGPDFTGTSAAFVVTEGGSTDVEITAAPHP